MPLQRTLILALGLLFAPLALHAQTGAVRDFRSGMRTGVGYAGVVPDAILGAGVFRMFGTRGLGVFADWKMTESGASGDPDYCPPQIAVCTEDWVLSERNDMRLDVADEWLIFNAGLVYAVTRELALMAGAGLARHETFAEYFHDEDDPELRITSSGAYFVDVEPQPGWGAQFVAGAMIRAGRRIAFRFGYETAPGGMSFGAYIVLP